MKPGLVIRRSEQQLGVQVPGEEDIRWLNSGLVRECGDGAYEENLYDDAEALSLLRQHAAKHGS